jgi:predicted MFS family arabinose efflux permease
MTQGVIEAAGAAGGRTGAKTVSMTTVVAASSAGTAFEWYDFFIFGTLTALISKNFFAGVSETAGFIFALGAFGAGFAFRPLGALVFGWLGDKVGRKGAFIVTVSLMGAATIGIGLLPTYRQIGIAAPAMLIVLRIVQGFALGGEYGGAAVYVAEHSPAGRRGFFTGWIQISASLGLIGALGLILATRKLIGEAAFADWGWRVPFLFSAVLLGVSLWMRAKLNESPAFRQMQAETTGPRAPIAEAFLTWRYLKVVLVALFGIMIAQGAVWYTMFFYSQFFIEKVLKLDPASVNMLMIAVTIVSAPLYVVFSALSDRLGRKPIMLFGMILAIVAVFPGFHLITRAANPALALATERTPVVVIADPADCSAQFDPVGKAAFLSSCDIAKSVLAGGGVSYRNQAAPAGTAAVVRIGGVEIASRSAKGLPNADAKAVKADVGGRLQAALSKAGYPLAADPKAVDWPLLFGVMMVFAVAATALYGPIASASVELFPTRIRYTAMSLPYNIGTGWVGGFLPAVAFAIVAAKGDMYSGLWYPAVITAIAAVVALLFLPETRDRDLYRAD